MDSCSNSVAITQGIMEAISTNENYSNTLNQLDRQICYDEAANVSATETSSSITEQLRSRRMSRDCDSNRNAWLFDLFLDLWYFFIDLLSSFELFVWDLVILRTAFTNVSSIYTTLQNITDTSFIIKSISGTDHKLNKYELKNGFRLRINTHEDNSSAGRHVQILEYINENQYSVNPSHSSYESKSNNGMINGIVDVDRDNGRGCILELDNFLDLWKIQSWSQCKQDRMGSWLMMCQNPCAIMEPLPGRKFINYHFVFDVKIDLTQEACLVDGGHLNKDVPRHVPYSSVVSKESKRIVFLLATLNNSSLLSGGIFECQTKREVFCKNNWWLIIWTHSSEKMIQIVWVLT